MDSIYINSISAISAQESFEAEKMPPFITYNEPWLKAIAPNYKQYINPRVLRRMSRTIRMGVTAARRCMLDAENENPDAIIIGTGLGCVQDTEKFLNQMIDTNEGLLSPTSFIQSTHNTIGAQIAVMLGNRNHNLTYVHENISFESALLDTILMISNGEAQNVLLGGIDEITEENYEIKKRVDIWRKSSVDNSQLFTKPEDAILGGEGATFFMVSDKKNENSFAKIEDLSFVMEGGTKENLSEKLDAFLQKNGLSPEDIDIYLTGVNGKPDNDKIYTDLSNFYLKNTPMTAFKHLCGEYETASAFGLWSASMIINDQEIPDFMLYKNGAPQKIKHILFHNQSENRNHSFVLLSEC